MTLGLFALIGIAGTGVVLQGAEIGNRELARRLLDDSTRAGAIAGIAASGIPRVPVLLKWTHKPPIRIDDFDRYRLNTALAEIFGRLRAQEAIPFLIQNITLQNWPLAPNTWMKTPEVIEQRMPAIEALIQIGPKAYDALIHIPWYRSEPEERLAAILVVSKLAVGMSDHSEAREFLASMAGQANMQRFWAEDGLKRLDKQH